MPERHVVVALQIQDAMGTSQLEQCAGAGRIARLPSQGHHLEESGQIHSNLAGRSASLEDCHGSDR